MIFWKESLKRLKKGNLELIEENGENLEAKVIGNIVKDSTEVKYEGESITHNSQDLWCSWSGIESSLYLQ